MRNDSIKAKNDQQHKKLSGKNITLKTTIEKIRYLHYNAEIGRLASGLYHDLASPLSIISLSLEILSNELEKKHRANFAYCTELVSRINTGTNALKKLLMVARKQIDKPGKRQTFSVKDEIDNIIFILNHQAMVAHVEVAIICASAIRIDGDQQKFCQLIKNLLVNAIESYENSTHRFSRRDVIIEVSETDKTISIQVVDYGVGIAKRYLQQVYNVLFTLKDPQHAGMGLFICKHIVENNFQGKIDLTSSLNKGTTVTITLPVSSQ